MKPLMRVFAVMAVATGLAFPVLAPTAAQAVPDDVQYSMNRGASWSATPPLAWFEDLGTLVPGDTVSHTVLMRLTRESPTFFQLSVDSATIGDSDLSGALRIQARDAEGAGLGPIRLRDLRGCDALVPSRVLSPGDVVSVNLPLFVAPTLVGPQAQNATAALRLALDLSDPGSTTSPDSCAVHPTIIPGIDGASRRRPVAGALAVTGSSLFLPSIAVALGAAGLGGIFMFAARRRRRSEGTNA